MYMYIFQRFHFKGLNRALIFFNTNINRWYPPYFILPDLSPKNSTNQPPTTHLFQNIYIILHVCTAFTKWKTCAFSMGIHENTKDFPTGNDNCNKEKSGMGKINGNLQQRKPFSSISMKLVHTHLQRLSVNVID